MGSIMNRAVKFKFWCKEVQGYIDPDETKIYINVDSEGLCANYEPSYGVYLGLRMLQHTGLKDQNGVAIFECDIVQCSMRHENGVLPYIGKVVYNSRFFGFSTKNDGEETLFHDHCIFTMKIIGNVFQNPELLEGGADND